MLSQFDPAVAGGIAASVLGVGGVGVAASKANKRSNGATAPAKGEKIDVSIPYDAAARMAFDEYLANGKEADFETFKKKYEQMTVAIIKAKKLEREMSVETEKGDVSIPYDAAARVAYEKYTAAKGQWGNQAEYEAFKKKYEEMSVAQVTFKKLEREMA